MLKVVLKVMLKVMLDTDILDIDSDYSVVIYSNWSGIVEVESVDDLSICKDIFVNKYIKYYMNRNVIAESSYLSQDYAIITTNDGEIIELFIT